MITPNYKCQGEINKLCWCQQAAVVATEIMKASSSKSVSNQCQIYTCTVFDRIKVSDVKTTGEVLCKPFFQLLTPYFYLLESVAGLKITAA